MSNPFEDQKKIMQIWEQTVDVFNPIQSELYSELIREESNEYFDAENAIEVVDGLIDMLVVTIGKLYSLGVDPQEAWNRVHASNLSKIDLDTGKVIKRSDGKVLKPDSYFPPKLDDLVEHLE